MDLEEKNTPLGQSPSTNMGSQYTIDSFDIGGEVGISYKGVGIKVSGKATYKKEDLFFNSGVEVDFPSLLDCARGESMLLYDAEAKRGWLVPKLSLLLHMAHTHNRLQDSRTTLPHAEPSHHGGRAADLALRGKGATHMEGVVGQPLDYSFVASMDTTFKW